MCDPGEGCGSCTVDCGPCPNCGNDQIDSGELCDGTDLNGKDCTTFGYSSGSLDCKNDCTGFDTSGCSSGPGGGNGGGGGSKQICVDNAFVGKGNTGNRPWNTRWDGKTTLPSKLTLAAGQRYNFSFTMLNRNYNILGNTTWFAGDYRFVSLSEKFNATCKTDAGTKKGYCDISGRIMPGTDWLGHLISFGGKVNITAPNETGTYTFQMRMVHRANEPYRVPVLGSDPVKFKTCAAPTSDTQFGETLTSTVTVVPVNNPKGFHVNADCKQSVGWSCDADDYTSPLTAYFYKDGPVGTGAFIGGILANNASDSSVSSQCGDNANHNFTFPTPSSLIDTSTHTIYAYSNNTGSGSDVLLAGSPKTIGPCCTNITRDCKIITFQQFKAIHKRYYKFKDRYDSSYVEALRNQTTGDLDIGDGVFYACQPKATDIGCCTNTSTCVFRGRCYADKEVAGDIDVDKIKERCFAQSPGQWIDDFETNCTNGEDDDFDGYRDCEDTDCAGSVNGTVINQDSQPISSADMQLKNDLEPLTSTTTNSQGIYSFPAVACGNNNILASHTEYAPQIKSVNLQPREDTFVNFTLVTGTSCEQDCTFAYDNIVHESCDGKNGCTFYDDTAKNACDNAQPGWTRDYNASHYVVCAPGVPQPKIEIKASLSCSSGTLVKITRIVLYNGKPVRLVVATCG